MLNSEIPRVCLQCLQCLPIRPSLRLSRQRPRCTTQSRTMSLMQRQIKTGRGRCGPHCSRGRCRKGEVQISGRRANPWTRSGLKRKLLHYDGGNCRAEARGWKICKNCLQRMQERTNLRLLHMETNPTRHLPCLCLIRDSQSPRDLTAATEVPIRSMARQRRQPTPSRPTRHSSDFQGGTRTAIPYFHCP